jgi:ABC-type multidrug transport system fused ATPase/permease subunit
MMLRDSKANLLTEALQGMRQIKYSGLERLWEEKILAKRNEEMRQSRRVSLWQYVLMFFMELGPVLLACVSFSVYAWENGTNIQASVIFTSLDLLGRISSSLALFPILQMFVVQAWTSCTRLEKYLSQADRQPIAKPGHLIAFERASVAWPKADDAGDRQTQQQPEHSMLRDISLEFPTGKLSVVTGKTGSGKSLLLAAVLGEVKLLSGSIYKPTPQPATDLVSDLIPDSEWIIPSLTAFVSQTPWIESGTLKENITYGLPFDESRYQKVLQACALAKDIEQLLDGEQTQVGPKGVTLSGGQRWRLALARALYSRAGIIILDDVLSAVDSHVGRVIVEEGLTGELAAGRTRILATHHPELVLPYASYLVRLREGILESAEDLTLSETVLSTQIDYRTATENKADAYLETETGSVGGLNGSKPNGTTSYTPKANRSGVDIRVGEDEEHELGRVKWKVYKAYYDASGAALYWTLGLGILLLLRLSGVAETWSLKEVSESASSESNHDPTRPNRPTASQSLSPQTFMGDIQSPSNGDSERQIIFWLGLYVLLHLLGGILRVAQCVASLTIGLKASQALFQQMTHAVLRAPLRWTDTIPSGRILNRFTSDMSSLEYGVSGQTLDFISSILQLLVIIGARCVYILCV